MKTLCIILLFVSCAHNFAPDWVRNLASGEERLVINNGEKLLYRRISHSCSNAIRKIEKAVSKEYKAVPVLEVQFVGADYCAVTMSISAKSLKKPYKAPVVQIGMDLWELRKKLKRHVHVSYDYRHPCWYEYGESGYSQLGDYVVCWKQLRVSGTYDLD